jgi:hypothetical protein
MILESIYTNITNSFGSLWKYKERGETLEIITPFATTNNRFISVFITLRQDSYIISDGGWINNNEYETILLSEDPCFEKVYLHYLHSFNIRTTKGNDNGVIFFKSTNNEAMIASMVFDIANFASAIVSASTIEFGDKKEIETKEMFRKTATNFISEIVPPENLEVNGYLDDEGYIKINAIVKRGSNLTLVNYITGSNPHYFNNSINKSNMIFELAAKSRYKDNIKSNIVVIDDGATGYVKPKISTFLNHFLEHTSTQPVNWSARINLRNYLN